MSKFNFTEKDKRIVKEYLSGLANLPAQMWSSEYIADLDEIITMQEPFETRELPLTKEQIQWLKENQEPNELSTGHRTSDVFLFI